MSKLDDLLEKQRLLEEHPPTLQPANLTLVDQVQDNLAMVEQLEAGITQSRDSVQEANNHLQYDLYQPKIKALEDERDQLMQGNMDAHEKERDQKQKEIDSLHVVVKQVKRIMDFLRVETDKDLAINDDAVTASLGGTKVHLGYIFDEDFLKIKLFIAENGKPKNKFTLIAVGRCLFRDHLLKLERGYVAGIHTGFGINLEVAIKDAPSIEELMTWQALPRAGEVFFALKGDYETIKAEYLDVIKNHELHDFKELMTDLCKCGYFYTIFDRVHRPDGVASCPGCHGNMERMVSVS